MAFKMDCPHCRKTLNITEKAFGKTVPCPGCKQPIAVPVSQPQTIGAAQTDGTTLSSVNTCSAGRAIPVKQMNDKQQLPPHGQRKRTILSTVLVVVFVVLVLGIVVTIAARRPTPTPPAPTAQAESASPTTPTLDYDIECKVIKRQLTKIATPWSVGPVIEIHVKGELKKSLGLRLTSPGGNRKSWMISDKNRDVEFPIDPGKTFENGIYTLTLGDDDERQYLFSKKINLSYDP
jgi:hypothetical protein